MKKRKIVDKIFKDKNGKLVLAQKWNPPIIAWGVATALGFFVQNGWPANVLDSISFGTLFTWAWLELFQGVNYFRRGLGLLVLTFTIINRI